MVQLTLKEGRRVNSISPKKQKPKTVLDDFCLPPTMPRVLPPASCLLPAAPCHRSGWWLVVGFAIAMGSAIAPAGAVPLALPQNAVSQNAVPKSPIPENAIANPLLNNPPLNLPLCYLQIQGGAPTDVSRICGKKTKLTQPNTPPTRSLTIAPINTPGSTPPPPDFSSAATAKQCNFVDANGKPCPKKDTPPPTDAAKPNPEVPK
jgi:hypothetical protein